MIMSDQIVNQIRKLIKQKYNEKCNEVDILKSLETIITNKINFELVRPFKVGRKQSKKKKAIIPGPALSEIPQVADAEPVQLN